MTSRMLHLLPLVLALVVVGGCAQRSNVRLNLDLERYSSEEAVAANTRFRSRLDIVGPPTGDSMELNRSVGTPGLVIVTPEVQIGELLFTSGDRNALSFKTDFAMIPRAALYPETGEPDTVTLVSMQFHAARGAITTIRIGSAPEALDQEAPLRAEPDDILFLEIWEHWLSAFALSDPERRETLIPIELRDQDDLSQPLPVWALTVRLDPIRATCRVTLVGPRQTTQEGREPVILGSDYCRPDNNAERMTIVVESSDALGPPAPSAPFHLLALNVSDQVP